MFLGKTARAVLFIYLFILIIYLFIHLFILGLGYSEYKMSLRHLCQKVKMSAKNDGSLSSRLRSQLMGLSLTKLR